jgi:hypothetical protein
MNGLVDHRWLLITLCLISLAGCEGAVVDSGGHTVLGGSASDSAEANSAKDLSQQQPTSDRLKALTTLISATSLPQSCDGSKDSYVGAYRSIELEKYRFNRFPVEQAQAEAARRFLIECVSQGPEDLIGPAMLGIGYHGSREDAELIFARAQAKGGESLVTYAASALAYVCDPLASQYLNQLSTRAKDDRVRESVQMNIETRATICSRQHGI